MITKEDILLVLKDVVDPEIPTITLIDLGVIQDIIINNKDEVTVVMTPTFSGCPATDYMKNDVIETLQNHGIDNCKVVISFEKPWNSNMITPKGIQALKKHGLAPPKQYILPEEINIITPAECPNCQSVNTTLKNSFGPTLCRAMHFCNDCKQMFEQFKAV